MLCAIANLNAETTENLISIQKAALSDAVVLKPLYGHITIATYAGDKDAHRFCKSGFAERCLIFAIKFLDPLFQLLDSFFLCRKNRCNHCNYKCTSGSRNKMPLTKVKEHPSAEKYKYEAQYQSYCIGFYKFHFHIPPSQIPVCRTDTDALPHTVRRSV